LDQDRELAAVFDTDFPETGLSFSFFSLERFVLLVEIYVVFSKESANFAIE
jgi:hypothetical protein